MAKVKVPYFTEKSNGRYYWQPSKALREAGWTTETLSKDRAKAIQRAEEINAKVQQWRNNPDIILPACDISAIGSVDWLIKLYKTSNDFQKLRPKTRHHYIQNMERISVWFGPMALVDISPQQVKRKYEDMAAKTPSFAQAIVVMMRILYRFAASENIIQSIFNPARDVKVTKPKSIKREGDLWTREDVDHFVKIADQMGYFSIGTAVMLNEYLGQRQGDVLTWQKSFYKDGSIDYTQSKTGASVYLPLDTFPKLKSRLEAEFKRHAERKVVATTIIVSEMTLQPFKQDNFRNVFDRIRIKAADTRPQLAKKTFQRLRHTAIVRLDEVQCTEAEISSVTGHSPKTVLDVLEHYRVRTKKLAQSAFEKRLKGEN